MNDYGETLGRFAKAIGLVLSASLLVGIVWIALYVVILPNGLPDLGVQPLAYVALPIAITGAIAFALLFFVLGLSGLTLYQTLYDSRRQLSARLWRPKYLVQQVWYPTLLCLAAIIQPRGFQIRLGSCNRRDHPSRHADPPIDRWCQKAWREDGVSYVCANTVHSDARSASLCILVRRFGASDDRRLAAANAIHFSVPASSLGFLGSHNAAQLRCLYAGLASLDRSLLWDLRVYVHVRINHLHLASFQAIPPRRLSETLAFAAGA